MLKYPTFSILGTNISSHRFVPVMQFVAVNLKCGIVSHIFELTTFNEAPKCESVMSEYSLFGYIQYDIAN